MNAGIVAEGDDVVQGETCTVVDLPLIAGADLGEGGAGAVADEAE